MMRIPRGKDSEPVNKNLWSVAEEVQVILMIIQVGYFKNSYIWLEIKAFREN